MTDCPPADCVLVDWGTSSLRVWALDGTGKLIAGRTSADGMGRMEPDGYEAALLALAGDLLPEKTTPVIICGMAGARGGWQEAAYRGLPCEPVTGGGLTRVETKDRRLAVSIIPGLCQASPPDVMRGEETQLGGLLAEGDFGNAVVCMPGTHSKWARLKGGRVTAFTTFMTGEIFDVVRRQSILRHSVDGEGHDDAAFRSAVAQMLEKPKDLTQALFSIRASALLEGLGRAAANARLSGLLIGAELASARRYWQEGSVHLVGADVLAERYAVAIAAAGGTVIRHDAEALTLAGLRQVHEMTREKVSP